MVSQSFEDWFQYHQKSGQYETLAMSKKKVITPRKKVYQPKKKQYNDLSALAKEMIIAGEKVINFDGHSIQTKTAYYGLFDGTVSVIEAVR